jgi:alpha-galactosidase
MTRRPSDPQGECIGKSRGSIGRKARILGACLLPAILVGSLITLAGLASSHARASSVVVTPIPTAAAARPPMGWNDWYEDRCAVSESDILTSARRLISSGLAADGYNTVVIDDCWMAKARSAAGALVADPATFPNGIPYIARQVHSLGLKLGIYESAGTKTCAGRPGSYNHYTQDADTFASWGVDFVKFDFCHLPSGANPATLFNQFGAALHKADPNIVYSQELPVHGGSAPASSAFTSLIAASAAISNMWRIAPDEKPTVAAGVSITRHLEADLPLNSYASPGHWNDLDMLLAGNSAFGYSLSEQENQADVWAMESSPLISSGDLTSAASLTVLGNKKVIDIDQEGVQGKLIDTEASVDVIAKPGSVMLINTTSTRAGVHFKTRDQLVNVWGNGEPARTTGGYLNRMLPAYGVLMFTTSKAGSSS